MIELHETTEGITFAVKVQPRARRNAITGEVGNAVKIALTAPPIEGRANEACIEYLAELLHLPRSALSILSGHSSRIKVIRVRGITMDDLRTRLKVS